MLSEVEDIHIVVMFLGHILMVGINDVINYCSEPFTLIEAKSFWQKSAQKLLF